jgi:carboxymethylenebutenolidase
MFIEVDKESCHIARGHICMDDRRGPSHQFTRLHRSRLGLPPSIPENENIDLRTDIQRPHKRAVRGRSRCDENSDRDASIRPSSGALRKAFLQNEDIVMGRSIELTAKDGHTFSVFRADPEGTPKGAIVVVQEIFGVNAHIRRVAEDYAGLGYVALAPALFDRVRPGIELGYDEAGITEGRSLRGRIGPEVPLADLQATIDEAVKFGKAGIVGYCWGGSLAFLAAMRLDGLACAVGYYGAQIAAHAEETTRVPVILHFGEADASIPPADIEKIRAAHPDMSIFVYPGAGHGFNCDERSSFDAGSAALALERTLRFFRDKVG